MKNIYIIGGSNGAGKTTASNSILPENLAIREFVNADEIARGLSPFNPESENIRAGKLMLSKISDLIKGDKNFAFETALSTRSFASLIKRVKEQGYKVTLIFFWLNTPELAIERVKTRVKEGGHNIPESVIIRRYHSGLNNLFNIYMDIVDDWILIDNSEKKFSFIATLENSKLNILESAKWNEIKSKYYGKDI